MRSQVYDIFHLFHFQSHLHFVQPWPNQEKPLDAIQFRPEWALYMFVYSYTNWFSIHFYLNYTISRMCFVQFRLFVAPFHAMQYSVIPDTGKQSTSKNCSLFAGAASRLCFYRICHVTRYTALRSPTLIFVFPFVLCARAVCRFSICCSDCLAGFPETFPSHSGHRHQRH